MKSLRDMTEPELSRLLGLCAQSVVGAFHDERIEKPMFALLVFNDPEVAQYVCNCRREDVIKAMRECASRLENKKDVPR